MTDFPRVRAWHWCPNCREAKEPVWGTLLCWPCHKAQAHFHDGGYGPNAIRKIEQLEIHLKAIHWPPHANV